MDADNYLTVKELEKILALMQYLNDFLLPPSSPIAIDCNVTDANGDPCGWVRYDGLQCEYVFKFS